MGNEFPSDDTGRERTLKIIRNLASGLNQKTDNSRAIEKHLESLNVQYPSTVVFSAPELKQEDHVKVQNAQEIIQALQRGPLSKEIRDKGFIFDLVKNSEGTRTRISIRED